ncbi:MAG: tRNA 2-thiocytidine(32) synthetase TtcA, partial [Clostridia bacterium]|nr:tRNA 2-thiocytidine(32) synthetase TtcA [Clostridia bacterium]
FDTREEKNPCSLCANLRSGRLHTLAKELGCNKLALGHHRDDAVDTFFMNLLDLGTLDCFKPVTYLSRKDLTMIRPLILTTEEDIEAAVRRQGLPVVKNPCPIDHETERARVDTLVKELEEQYPGLSQKTIGALQKSHLSGW